ncbi:sialate O-acetylesterase [Erythrobacter cryptus]|uniref:sialate O-acetylesterase n=1 Tax=Erythrobacter cryptus TaxID=196588 RepID=UPI000408C4CF|nr:sialate O-acetylesterase [Erythrobacter cryptus]
MARTALSALALGLALGMPITAQASPALDPGYGAGMVLQAGMPVVLSGTTDPGARVTAQLDTISAEAEADAEGRFVLTLPAQPASTTPRVLTLRDARGATILANILIGNVFLCGGQSNMELPVTRALDADTQLARAADDNIRLLMVPKATAPLPQRSLAAPARWQAATRESVAPFSAACFYLAKALRRRDPATPVGLIHANWGGSAARAWLDPEAVGALYGPEARELLALFARDPLAATRAFAPQWLAWWRRENGGREPWRRPDALTWRPIPQFSFWNDWKGTGLDTNPRANVWLRQTLTLTPAQARGDGTLAIGAIDDMDFTFVNGEPVGYTFGWGVERHYRVPARLLRPGRNEILIAANNAWDTGGFNAGPERLFFTAANGEKVPLGADWRYWLSPVQGVPPRAPWDANAGLGVMHNAMIAPLGAMRLAAVAWYQGESDVGQPGYAARLAQLFAGWRRQFGPEVRMLVVQLADFGERRSTPGESDWAELREAQRRAVASDPAAALVSAIDLGEPSDIHPANKNVLGERLAAAFAGRAMPMPLRAVSRGGEIEVAFSGLMGSLTVHSGPYPLGIELCEATPGTCRFVLARAEGQRLVIPVPEGMAPTRVRHAWADAPVVNLYDESGLPIPGFELAITR